MNVLHLSALTLATLSLTLASCGRPLAAATIAPLVSPQDSPVNLSLNESSTQQTLTFKNAGGTSLAYSVTTNVPWLSLAATAGTVAPGATASVAYTLSCQNTPGMHTGTITVSGTGAAAHIQKAFTVSVQCNDTQGPTFVVTAPATTTQSTIVIAGSVSDDVGIESLTYRLGEGTDQDVNITPGSDVPVDLGVSNLTPGLNTITLTATDSSGNHTEHVVTVTFAPPAAGDTTGPALDFPVDLMSNSQGIIIQGTAADAGSGLSALEYSVTGAAGIVAQGDLLTSTGPSATYDPTTGVVRLDLALSDGRYTLSVTATDNAGNPSSHTAELTVDTLKPAIALKNVSTVPNQADATLADLTLSGTITDSGAGIDAQSAIITLVPTGTDCTAAGACPPENLTVDAQGTFSFQRTALPEGNYTLNVSAADRAGNVRNSTTQLAVAPAAPTISLTADDAYNTADVIIEGTVFSVVNGAQVTYSLSRPNTEPLTGSVPVQDGVVAIPFTGLVEGAYTLILSASNTSGPTSATTSFVVDLSPPTISTPTQVTTAKGKNGRNLQSRIDFGVTDAVGIASVEYRKDGGAWSRLTPGAGSTSTSQNFQLTVTDKQAFMIEIRAADTAGSPSPITTVSVTGPTN